MTFKTPSFWYRSPSVPAPCTERFLTPVSKLYGMGFKIHHKFKKPAHAPVPVLCIGNIAAGGTGKTPTSIALLRTLKKRALFKNPFFLIRGYGGAEMGPLLVDPDAHTAWDVGDEALILARHAPTVVGGDRVAGAQLAFENGADALVMDDGLQNPGIHKDIKLVVMNGEMGFGNQKLMPAGPLRQNMEDGFEMADGFIMIGEDKHQATSLLPSNKPLIHAHLEPSTDFNPDKSLKYLAFAGLGYPKKFFRFLEKTGLDLCETIAFSDHHPYARKDLKMLHEKAKAHGAQLITTEKDFMRLPKSDYIRVDTVPVEMVWDNEEALASLIKDRLQSQA